MASKSSWALQSRFNDLFVGLTTPQERMRLMRGYRWVAGRQNFMALMLMVFGFAVALGGLLIP